MFVASEEWGRSAEVTEHVVESGINISDHVKRNATTLSLSGEIVGRNASNVINQIKNMLANGTSCTYVGRSSMSGLLITDFSTGHPYTIWGGCEFSMSLKEVRTAATSYKSPQKKNTKNTGTQQKKNNSTSKYVYHTVKKGDCIWNLVAASNAPYKKYGLSCDEVMKLNPDAFSRKGDFRTLQIGEKIIIGVR